MHSHQFLIFNCWLSSKLSTLCTYGISNWATYEAEVRTRLQKQREGSHFRHISVIFSFCLVFSVTSVFWPNYGAGLDLSLDKKTEITGNTKQNMKITEMLHSLAPKSEETENTKGKLKQTLKCSIIYAQSLKNGKQNKQQRKTWKTKTEMCLIVWRFHPPVAAVTHEHLAVEHSFQRAEARKGIVDDSQGCINHIWFQKKIQSCL